ncbi:hypothetical protein CDO73_12900 [Saccharibacillus sp. O23]|uniref:hypothetical protein n=1 Tax=Saccharibacillus sp. O23 TaxID=2009338 RepID=UPI000B4E3498|nr:hypothetical protein [Saccharibacillus sp. O23]OWR29970.1 hypothetical protein CDO73_12900 [Saccharibacillus sp. O23]
MDWQHRRIWNDLSSEVKQQRMSELEATLPKGFEFVRTETFERFGQSSETGVFLYGGAEFLFVPGDEAGLGWDGESMDAERLEMFGRSFGMSPEETKTALRSQMSPVREVSIRPMLVERAFSSAGWFDYDPSKLDPEEDDDLLEELEHFRQMPQQSLEIYQFARMERVEGEIRLQLFDDSETYEEWREDLIADPFDLPTEDEWEYVYAAGARTLFPWGDRIEPSMRLKYFSGTTSSQDGPIVYDLEQPNVFGLRFSGDPYRKELVVTPSGVRGKGGDGGASLHGGLGRELGYLPVATAFRDPYEHELDWPELLDGVVYRRIVRL